jgi:hypothetical protein
MRKIIFIALVVLLFSFNVSVFARTADPGRFPEQVPMSPPPVGIFPNVQNNMQESPQDFGPNVQSDDGAPTGTFDSSFKEQSDGQKKESAGKPELSGSKTWIWVLAGFLVLAVAAAVYIFLSKRNTGNG